MAVTAQIVPKSRGSNADLIGATIARFERDVEIRIDVGVAFASTIPRSVGLAGSSAIVIAAIRALSLHSGAELGPADVARMAYAVERNDLGIAGGWQDQVIQSHGVSGLMEFADGFTFHPTNVPDAPHLPLYIAWTDEASEPSGDSHADLQSRRREVASKMAELAELARQAADAIEGRRIHELKEAINATFDLRRQIMPISPAHLAMVETARSLGAASNFAGSGGAIVGVVPKAKAKFLSGIRDAGLQVVTWSGS